MVFLVNKNLVVKVKIIKCKYWLCYTVIKSQLIVNFSTQTFHANLLCCVIEWLGMVVVYTCKCTALKNIVPLHSKLLCEKEMLVFCDSRHGWSYPRGNGEYF